MDCAVAKPLDNSNKLGVTLQGTDGQRYGAGGLHVTSPDRLATRPLLAVAYKRNLVISKHWMNRCHIANRHWEAVAVAAPSDTQPIRYQSCFAQAWNLK
jgi:hypothetical protein